MLNQLHSKRNKVVTITGKLLAIPLFCFLSVFQLSGEDRDLSFDLIPKHLLENAKAVLRYKEVVLEIQSADQAVMKVSFALTIVNENGIKNSGLTEFYNSFSRIRNIKARVFGSNGKSVERISQDEIEDFSAISGISIYEDNRVKVIRPEYRTVPFTVEYSYEIVYSGILDYPDFYLVEDFNIAVEKASLMIVVPDSTGVKYLERHITSPCSTGKTENKRSLMWNFNDIPALREEPLSPPVTECIPSVLIAPNTFEIKNRSGSAKSWEDFGKWIWELNKGLDELPAENIEEITKLVSGITDTLQKINILYNYLQSNTRYVSIQIGLGGWQPFPAGTVHRNSYGDCKALSNYMLTLLKVAGIPSFYTLVGAGDKTARMITDFPSSQFNHAMLCVPVKSDTIWIECTSQHYPLGYLGKFTDDRNVLLITEKGGKLGHTTKYGEKDNIQSRTSNVLLDREGNSTITTSTSYKGIYYDDKLRLILGDDTDRKKNIEEGIKAGSFKLEKFALEEKKTPVPEIRENLNLSVQKTGVKSGDMLIVTPNLLSRKESYPISMTKRKNPVWNSHSVTEIDTVLITLPEGYEFKGNHLNESFRSDYGEYRALTGIVDGKIRYVRHFTAYKGFYPSESYNDFIGFYGKVELADNKKIALKTVK